MAQTEKIYLDIGGKRKSVDFRFLTGDSDVNILFLLTYNDYYLDIKIPFEVTVEIIEKNNFTVKQSKKFVNKDVVFMNNIPTINMAITQEILFNENSYSIDISVFINNQHITLPNFIMFFNSSETHESKQIRKVKESYNQALDKYLNVIKRNQINKPNGVIGLDKDGRTDISVFSSLVVTHLQDKIMIGEVHELRLRPDYYLEYYDEDSQSWLMVDRLEGGEFTIQQKDIEIDAGTF